MRNHFEGSQHPNSRQRNNKFRLANGEIFLGLFVKERIRERKQERTRKNLNGKREKSKREIKVE